MSLDIRRVRKTVGKLRKLLQRSPRRPGPDEVHDLRTHTRRLELRLGALALDSKANERRLLRDLGRIRKRAGRIRDMDVVVGHACHVHVANENHCLVEVLEHLGAQRYRHADRLHGIMRKSRGRLLRRLKRTAHRFDRVGDSRREARGGQNSAAADATASAIQLCSELMTPAGLNRSNPHPYRLKVKELSYVLQMADEAGNQELLEMLGEIKDVIGEWHDWEELIAISKQVLSHGPGCRLLAEFKAISNHKYEQGLALALKLRKNYLRAPVRATKRRRAAAAKIGQPVLEAASAIAA